jgi:hypothetical protein
MGWKELLCEKYGWELVNSAMFAGSNDLSVRRIHSHIVNNHIKKDDIIIWQITGQLRHSFSVHCDTEWLYRLNDVETEDDDAKYYIDAPRNYFTGNVHKDVLSNHPITTKASEYFDFNSSLEELISTIILLNSAHKVLIIMGWEGALREDGENYYKFMSLLSSNNVPHINESYVSWAIRNKHPLAEDLHPTMDTSELYGETVLFPELERLGWI